MVQFIHNDEVPLSVRKASSHYLDHHSNVRNIEFEHGVMVPAKSRLDLRTSSITKYLLARNKGKKDVHGITNRDLHLSLLDFNQLFYDLSDWLLRSLNSSIARQLKNSGNTLDLKIRDRTHHLLPTYLCSSSVHNAVHINLNDFSSSFAISIKKNRGLGRRILRSLKSVFSFNFCLLC